MAPVGHYSDSISVCQCPLNVKQHAVVLCDEEIVYRFLMVTKYVFNKWCNTSKREIEKFPVVIR